MSLADSHGGTRQPWGWEDVTEADDEGGSSTTLSLEVDRAKREAADPLLNRGKARAGGMSVWSSLIIGVVFIFTVVGIISSIIEYEVVHGTAAVAIRCMDNTACARVGMVGDCCPTYSGQKLACCSADDNYVTRHITTVGACDDNSACAKLGMSGMCCPSAAGTDLACCTDDDNVVSKPHAISATCSANSACHFQKLTGNCCPTDDGNMLGCCPPGASDGEDDGESDDHRRLALPSWLS